MNSINNKRPKQILEINTDNIELYKVLKLEGLCSSGGEAKLLIADGQVTVNGVAETRKRKKIVSGDLVQLDDKKIMIRQTKQALP